MDDKKSRWEKVNSVYLFFLGAAGIVWMLQLNTFGICVGIAASAIAYFMYQRNRWAYFCAAAWCFGLLRIAMDDGYDFHQGWQSASKLIYLVGLVFAFILHEKVAIKPSREHDVPE